MLNYLPGFSRNNEQALKEDKTELSSPSKNSNEDEEGQSLLGSTKEKLDKELDAKTEEYSKPNYVMMILFFGAGCLFLLASLTSLPFLLLSPSGFNMYFSMSSFCFLSSVGYYYGPCIYLKKLFGEKQNMFISFLYIGSTAAALYTSLFYRIGYLYTLGLIIVQALSVFFFVFQAWTSGDRAQEKLKEFANQAV